MSRSHPVTVSQRLRARVPHGKFRCYKEDVMVAYALTSSVLMLIHGETLGKELAKQVHIPKVFLYLSWNPVGEA